MCILYVRSNLKHSHYASAVCQWDRVVMRMRLWNCRQSESGGLASPTDGAGFFIWHQNNRLLCLCLYRRSKEQSESLWWMGFFSAVCFDESLSEGIDSLTLEYGFSNCWSRFPHKTRWSAAWAVCIHNIGWTHDPSHSGEICFCVRHETGGFDDSLSEGIDRIWLVDAFSNW